MDAVKKIVGFDLREAKQVEDFHGAMMEFIRGAKAAYTLNTFGGFYNRQAGCLEVSVPRHADVMAPHSIDIPPWQIISIAFEQGPCFTQFKSMQEASFYFHLRLIDLIEHGFHMRIYLKPGLVIDRCKTVWRCYFLDMDSRNLVIHVDNENAIQFPVGKNIVCRRGNFEKRHMAKL